MLKLTNIVKDYIAAGSTVHALRGVSVNFRDSEFVSILGPSGCGKTTLLNILAALDKPTGGSVILDGMDLAKIKESKLADFRRDNLGFVF